MIRTPRHVLLRRRVLANVVDGSFSALARTAGRLPAANPARHGVERIAGIAYRDTGSADHTVDIYRPVERRGPLPVVVYFHGGAFRALSKDTHYLMGIAFARRGYVVVSANYRLAPRHRFPAAPEDACAAWLWAAEHAAEFGGDPRQVAVAGESAGANLAAVIAVVSAWQRPEAWARRVYDLGPRPLAVLPACGIFQVSNPERFRRRLLTPAYEVIANLEHGYLPEVRDGVNLDMADPLCVVEGTAPNRPVAPFFLPVGSWDPLVDDSRRMAAALTRHRVRAELRIYDGEIHAFHAFLWRKNARRCWREMLDFLDQHASAG